MIRRLSLILTVIALGAIGQPALDKLPEDLREQGRLLLTETAPKTRAKMADDLGKRNPNGTRDFLLTVLETEPSAVVRRAILDRVVRVPNEAVTQALARHAASDPDPEVAIFALDRYRYELMTEARKLLDKRLALSGNDTPEGVKMLAREDERWISLVRGTMLPTFLQDPPPLFTLKAPNQSIRVLAFGDYGNGSKNQRDVANAMRQFHDKTKFDFGITLGDNFYSKGMLSTKDPHWSTWWDEMYNGLGIQVYATLGNHDWGYADSPAAEVLYTHHSPSWRMPATYYTFTAGPVQFFALDTNEISRAQLAWLDEEIGKSKATWKVVYGHHPIYSAGQHYDSPRLIRQLLPVLRDRVDVYIAGHDHDMQHLKSEAGVHFFVAGGAGAGLRVPKPHERAIFAQNLHGFAVLDVTPKSFQVRFIGTDLKEIYTHTITR
jgi:tartrate-resistant acid phosphatase type 5